MLQNQTLREITFKRLHDSTNEIHNNLKILRFSGSVCMQNCLFMNQNEQNEKIVKSFSKLKYCGDNHNYQTRPAARKLLDNPCFSINFYGTQSAKYHCITDWDNLKKQSSSLTPLEHTHSAIKSLPKTLSRSVLRLN